jgi:hypothetical protein
MISVKRKNAQPLNLLVTIRRPPRHHILSFVIAGNAVSNVCDTNFLAFIYALAGFSWGVSGAGPSDILLTGKLRYLLLKRRFRWIDHCCFLKSQYCIFQIILLLVSISQCFPADSRRRIEIGIPLK